jgi:hypothetical protein
MSDWSTATPEQIIADIRAVKQRIRDEYLALFTDGGNTPS